MWKALSQSSGPSRLILAGLEVYPIVSGLPKRTGDAQTPFEFLAARDSWMGGRPFDLFSLRDCSRQSACTARIFPVTPPIRLLAVDIDGTLLNSQFRISDRDIDALRYAHGSGIEVILVTGRRHTFALPMAAQLAFDLWLISSNGAVTRSSRGESFHRDLLPVETCRQLCLAMREFRGNMVVTFDKESKGALVLERMDELTQSIQKWLEKNIEYIEFVVPLENSLTTDPVQAMFCGPMARMSEALTALEASPLKERVTILRTEYPLRDLMIVDVLNRGCSKGHAVERWAVHRGIAREQVMAIGDNHNDVEMLAFAGYPFIMGNACEELKARGWPVTLTSDECGVAAAIGQVLTEMSSSPETRERWGTQKVQ